MKVDYIGHSGFLVETASCYYLFDYYKGELPQMNAAKAVIVFCSHGHGDHYRPEIFTKLQALGLQDIFTVLSDDIPDDPKLSNIKNRLRLFNSPAPHS